MQALAERPLIAGYITIKEASEKKGCKPRALYMWMRDNNTPCQKVGKTIVVRESDLVGYLPRGAKAL